MTENDEARAVAEPNGTGAGADDERKAAEHAPVERVRQEVADRRPRAVQEATAEDWLGSNRDPDVLLSVPDLGVDKIRLTVQDLTAHVNLHAKVLDLLELRVGADVALGSVELDIDNVRAQSMRRSSSTRSPRSSTAS